jgi:uncharacterized protein YerC
MYWNLTDKDRLFEAFVLAQESKLMGKFLEDILTEHEMKECILRLKALCMLYDGATYKNVRLITGFSPATTARLAEKLKNNEGGITKVIRKFKRLGPAYRD